MTTTVRRTPSHRRVRAAAGAAVEIREAGARRGRPRWSAPLAVVVAAAVTVGCGAGGSGSAGTASGTSAASSGTAPGTTATSSVPTTTSAPAASPVVTTPGRPGEPGFPFRAGSSLSVVGVANDDVLNVRAGPAPPFSVVETLSPVADGVITTGRVWQSESSWWVEVSTGGVTGWANLRFLAGRDGTDDVTAQVVSRLGSRPVAETMLDLGRTVAASRVYGPEPSSIVMSVAPTVGDLGEVTYDVVGLSDDSVWAERLHVFGQPTGEGFSLKSVEATSFCARGVPAAGGPCP